MLTITNEIITIKRRPNISGGALPFYILFYVFNFCSDGFLHATDNYE